MGNKYLVKAKEYKVKDGDSLDSIAKANGLTWQELSKFNFGTDEPKEINKFLRSRVGSFKKAKDGINYSFTSKDDPGIIYIPETFPEKSFPVGSTNTIVVKPIVLKTFVPSKVAVEFRPKDDWDGEYGFDWVRNGDTGETAYKGIITGGFKEPGVDGKGVSFTSDEAYNEFKKDFRSIESAVKKFNRYRVPYLNLYPPTASGSPPPPTKAELKILITVEKEEPLSIEFDYNKNLLKLDKDSLSDKAVGAKRIASDKTLKIECIEEFDSDQEIKVLAYPKSWKVGDPIPIAGKIIIGANSKPNRHRVKIVLVNVLTNIKGVPNAGAFNNVDKKYLRNALYQSLIYGQMEKGADLDLTKDLNFKIKRGFFGGKTYGKFIYKNAGGGDTFTDGGIYHHYPNEEMFTYLKAEFLKITGNEKYKDYFTAFAFKEDSGRPAGGSVQDIGKHNMVLFTNRKTTAFAHETLHGLGLWHVHSDGGTGIEKDRKFTFQFKTTDNIMSYSDARKSTWHWQWRILRKGL